MRKHRVYFILPVLALAGVLVAVFRREREPEYRGKRLSEWVESYAATPSAVEGSFEFQQADGAIRQFGTNALPYLMKWIRYESPARKQRLHTAINSMLQPLNRWWWLNDGRQLARAIGAMHALIVLGPSAEGAIGELTQIVHDPKGQLSRLRAVGVFTGLGKAGLPALIGVLTNQPAEGNGWTAMSTLSANMIVEMGTNAAPAIPALVNLLKDPDPTMRNVATDALRKIDPEALERGTR